MKITESVLEQKVKQLSALMPGQKYVLDFAYGGVALHRELDRGGVACVFSTGHISKPALYAAIDAYIRGVMDYRDANPAPRREIEVSKTLVNLILNNYFSGQEFTLITHSDGGISVDLSKVDADNYSFDQVVALTSGIFKKVVMVDDCGGKLLILGGVR